LPLSGFVKIVQFELHLWDGQHFDKILLDAPCSATGVIRRHPDIKLLRKPKDISALK
jgi:16S rRNA (cytosine967-C5)-methyltransferase